jgi:hypothetical protein
VWPRRPDFRAGFLRAVGTDPRYREGDLSQAIFTGELDDRWGAGDTLNAFLIFADENLPGGATRMPVRLGLEALPEPPRQRSLWTAEIV